MDADLVNGAVEKRVARLLANLPPKDLLALTTTRDQIEYWQGSRIFHVCLSRCWSALHQGEDDPIRPMLESGEIDRTGYNCIWLTVYMYERLWELIQISFHLVRPELTRLGVGDKPKSAYELFACAIYEIADDDFSVCLEPYREISSKKYAKTHRLLKKVREGKATSIEEKQASRPLTQEIRDTVIFLILSICHKKATRREPLLKAKLEDFYAASDKLHDNAATVCRKKGSYAWKNGEMKKGSKYGGTYSN